MLIQVGFPIVEKISLLETGTIMSFEMKQPVGFRAEEGSDLTHMFP